MRILPLALCLLLAPAAPVLAADPRADFEAERGALRDALANGRFADAVTRGEAALQKMAAARETAAEPYLLFDVIRASARTLDLPRIERHAARYRTLKDTGSQGARVEQLVFVTGELAREDVVTEGCKPSAAAACTRAGLAAWRGAGGKGANTARALRMFLVGCDGGDAEACKELGDFGSRGIGAANILLDGDDVFRAFMRACQLGSAGGCTRLAEHVVLTEPMKHTQKQAWPLLTARCGQDPRACGGVGLFSRAGASGVPVVKDVKEAANALRKACDAGETWSCTHLGLMLANPAESTRVLDLACKAEGPACRIAASRLEGPDPAAAHGLYQRGCALGDEQACRSIVWGHAFAELGLKKDVDRARELAKASCARDGMTCSFLAEMLPEVERPAVYRRGCLLGSSTSCTPWAEILRAKGDQRLAGAVATQMCDGPDEKACYTVGMLGGARALVAFKKACDADNLDACYRYGLLGKDDSWASKEKVTAALDRACKGGIREACGVIGDVGIAPGTPPASTFTAADLEARVKGGESLAGLVIARIPLKGANLKGANLKGATIAAVDLSGADLDGATLEGATFSQVTFTETRLVGANLNKAKLEKADLSKAILSDGVRGATFVDAVLEQARMSGADLRHVDFSGAKAKSISLTRARLENAALILTDLTKGDLSGARLMNANLSQATLIGASLSGADLTGGTLQSAAVAFADATGAILDRCNLSFTDFKETSLKGASLKGATFDQTSFLHADLGGVVVCDVPAAKVSFKGTRYNSAATDSCWEKIEAGN